MPGQITMPENAAIKADRPYHDLEWQSAQYGIQLKICGDSKVVVDWINGTCAIKGKQCKPHVNLTRHTLANLWSYHNTVPAPIYGEWITHQFREHNKLADRLATIAVVERKAAWVQKPLPQNALAIWGSFDRGKRSSGSGMGWWLAAGTLVQSPSAGSKLQWTIIAMAHTPLLGSVPEAELHGATTLALAVKLAIVKRDNTDASLTRKLQSQLESKLQTKMRHNNLPIRAVLKRTQINKPCVWTCHSQKLLREKLAISRRLKRKNKRKTHKKSICTEIELQNLTWEKGKSKTTRRYSSYNDYYLLKGNKRLLRQAPQRP